MRKKIAAVAVICLALSGCDLGNSIDRGYHDTSADYRFAGENISYEYDTITDTETGVVYLVWHNNKGSKYAEGGITPLFKKDGSLVIDERYLDGSKE